MALIFFVFHKVFIIQINTQFKPHLFCHKHKTVCLPQKNTNAVHFPHNLHSISYCYRHTVPKGEPYIARCLSAYQNNMTPENAFHCVLIRDMFVLMHALLVD